MAISLVAAFFGGDVIAAALVKHENKPQTVKLATCSMALFS
jgi:hypothetical protein